LKKRIICAGVHRSGSTWLFNAVRLILLENNQNVYSCWEEDYDLTNPADYHVIKTHNMKRNLLRDQSCVFTTMRDIRDIAASAIRRKMIDLEEEEIIQFLRRVIYKEYFPWKKHTILEIRYEQLFGRKIDYIEKIANILSQECNAEKVHKKIESLKLDNNPITQLHTNHITNGGIHTYEITLQPKYIKCIENEFGEFIEQYVSNT
jgi:hypothetical protein